MTKSGDAVELVRISQLLHCTIVALDDWIGDNDLIKPPI